MLQAKGIQKSYGNLQILKGVDLEVSKAEIVTIIGASGAGKSTLLHIIGTLDRPDQGKVLVNNIDVNSLTSKKLSAFRNQYIGFIFQFHHLLPEFTALENICIPAFIAKHGKKDTEMRAFELLDLLGLRDRANHKPNELSGGQKQRIAIARALVSNPRIILADEPTGNLDSKTSYEIMDILGKIHNDGNTVILVTHEVDISDFAHRVIRLKDGMVETDKINEHPSKIELVPN
jgi:lipoprotein-releasing system ATP-binding protein